MIITGYREDCTMSPERNSSSAVNLDYNNAPKELVDLDKDKPVEVVTIDDGDGGGENDDIQMVGEEYKMLFQCKFCRTLFTTRQSHNLHVNKKHPVELDILNAQEDNNDDGELVENDPFFQSQQKTDFSDSKYKVSKVGQRGPRRRPKKIGGENGQVECSSTPTPTLPPSRSEHERSSALEQWRESQSQAATASPTSSSSTDIVYSSVARNAAADSTTASNEEEPEVRIGEEALPRLEYELDPEEWPSLEESNRVGEDDQEEDMNNNEHQEASGGEDEECNIIQEPEPVSIAVVEEIENPVIHSASAGDGTPNSNVTLQDVKVEPEVQPPSPHKKLPRKYAEMVTVSDAEDDPNPKRPRWSLRNNVRRGRAQKYKETEGEESEPERAGSTLRRRRRTTVKAQRKRGNAKRRTHPSRETLRSQSFDDLPNYLALSPPLYSISDNTEEEEMPAPGTSPGIPDSDSNPPVFDSFSCEHCDKAFTKERSLEFHVNKVHRKQEVQNSCDTSDTEQEERPVHATSNKDDLHLCKWCGESFKNGDAMRRHAIDMHVKKFYVKPRISE